MRTAETERNTAETRISLRLDLDGSGENRIDSGCGFLNHMLTLFSRHGGFDLGRAVHEALGDLRGIRRYGSMLLPMDETLILCALDISGRAGFYPELKIPTEKVGDFDTELCEEFFTAFSREAGITLHLRQLAGSNSHHIIEGCFKAFARALSTAVSIDEKNADRVPSTKGVLG